MIYWDQEIVIVDLETEWITPDTLIPRPFEIGAVKCTKDLEIKEVFYRMINPGVPVSPELTKFNKITQDEVDKTGESWEEVGKDFAEFCEYEKCLLAAWPTSFEAMILRNEYRLLGTEYPLSKIPLDIPSVIRTCMRTWGMKAGKFSVNSVMKALGAERIGTEHRALDDARTEHHLLLKTTDLMNQ